MVLIYTLGKGLDMFGGDDYGPDDVCEHCGAHIYFEVGFGSPYCENCGGHIHPPKSFTTQYDTSRDDVLHDPRYLTFDQVAAFRYLRDQGLLDHFCGDFYD